MIQEQAAIPGPNTVPSTRFSGDITRRAFLISTLGLSVSVLSLLAGCSSPPPPPPPCSCDPTMTPPAFSRGRNSSPLQLSWYSEYGDTRVYDELVSNFHALHPDITVTHTLGSQKADQHHRDLVSLLEQGTGPEIMSLDVTWIEEFAKRKWLMSLCDWWPSQDRNNYLPIPLQMATVDCKVYAAPFRADIGLLYYRTDIFPPDRFPNPPTTWQELARRASWAQQTKKIPFGYVWQGDQYEGLVCNFLEVLGKALDLNDPQGFNAALDALETMGQWRGTISPPDILTYREDKALNKWTQGSAAFMRNWTYAIALSNDVNRSQVAGNFKIAPLPSGHSCIGGWQLGINAQASSEKQAAAWTFISYMLSVDAQQHAAIGESLMPTLKTMYKMPELSYISGRKNPFVAELPPLLDKGLSRPVSPCYQQGISLKIQQALSQALAQSRPSQSREQYRSIMKALQNELQHFTCPLH